MALLDQQLETNWLTKWKKTKLDFLPHIVPKHTQMQFQIGQNGKAFKENIEDRCKTITTEGRKGN